MHTPLRATLFIAGAAALVSLAGCSGQSVDPGPSTTPSSSRSASAPVTSAAAGTSTTTPSSTPSASCGPASGAEAASAAIAALPLPSGLEGNKWDAANADHSGYDACAALSWSVVTVDGGTPSSPYAVLLFHDGSYLGTATSRQYGFSPTVTRTGADAITVTYRYAKASDSNADPTGRTTATYTWDASTGKVVMTGDVPPEG
ncbi:LppP/LprE family lipoprotein [Curtobacterium sp. Leaf261]|uniref:LppP/LprE family lipoprotein n=1 Tax=Curtobacterium sp. Leaf261 TaxID=1736311 RepID=UPI0006F8CF83|nr:LppP/LprE family lipoprotein [Curtobacterium sp. Leaf261]KQO60046.1 hypothetical protein ASF23_15485 [Curtobacterium sp. Leaf261]